MGGVCHRDTCKDEKTCTISRHLWFDTSYTLLSNMSQRLMGGQHRPAHSVAVSCSAGLPATLSVFLVCFTGSKGKMPPTRAGKTEDNT